MWLTKGRFKAVLLLKACALTVVVVWVLKVKVFSTEITASRDGSAHDPLKYAIGSANEGTKTAPKPIANKRSLKTECPPQPSGSDNMMCRDRPN